MRTSLVFVVARLVRIKCSDASAALISALRSFAAATLQAKLGVVKLGVQGSPEGA